MNLRKILSGLLLVVSFLLVSHPAFAVWSHDQFIRSSDVTTQTALNGGVWTYDYTVINTSRGGWLGDANGNPIYDPITGGLSDVWPTIVDYEVPLTNPSDIWNILSPNGWTYEILSDVEYLTRYEEENPFNASYILHWHDSAITWNEETQDFTGLAANPIVPNFYPFGGTYYQDRINGFIFESNFAPVAGPYATSWQDEQRFIADPPLPGGSVGGNGTLPYEQRNSSAVPEPATMLLFGSGLVGFLFRRRSS